MAKKREVRSDSGLMLSLNDHEGTIELSDAGGNKVVTIDVKRGRVTVKASTTVLIDAPQIELAAGGSHPAVFGDDLLQYLDQMTSVFNTHVHPGEMAALVPVTPMPPTPPMPVPAPGMLSTTVICG